ncbi:uncharacterized protein IUM83_06473 [Phytophthora cinnamomi]|uniref:uncharacterized protein n=1 Tax=Phytophthora cinnamomi TaxID=4785 RepID=UPI00355A3E41|nr:hypothetical protein IUM83_06473 [Phytophthora cinnamomi]
MAHSDSSPPVCSSCGDAPCEWQQFSKVIIGNSLRMLTSTHKRRTPRRIKRSLLHLYFYLKHGFLCKTTEVAAPCCVEKQIDNLNGTISRVCAASPDAAVHTASSAERTVREVDVSVFR